MKKLFLLLAALFICNQICYASETKVSEQDIQKMIRKFEENSDTKFHEEQTRRIRLDMVDASTVVISGIYSPGSFFRVCNDKLELSAGYGEPKEMDRLNAIYFLLTKEPYEADNFEPQSLIYIEAQGKIKTEKSRSGDIEGIFFLTKLLDYSSNQEIIKKCQKN